MDSAADRLFALTLRCSLFSFRRRKLINDILSCAAIVDRPPAALGYTFVWAKAVKKQLEKLEVRIAKEVPVIALRYDLSPGTSLDDAFHIL